MAISRVKFSTCTHTLPMRQPHMPPTSTHTIQFQNNNSNLHIIVTMCVYACKIALFMFVEHVHDRNARISCTHMYIHICICIYIYICMYIWYSETHALHVMCDKHTHCRVSVVSRDANVCVCVCVYIYIYIYIILRLTHYMSCVRSIHTQDQAYTHKIKHTHTRTSIHTQDQAYTHKIKHTHTRSSIRTQDPDAQHTHCRVSAVSRDVWVREVPWELRAWRAWRASRWEHVQAWPTQCYMFYCVSMYRILVYCACTPGTVIHTS